MQIVGKWIPQNNKNRKADKIVSKLNKPCKSGHTTGFAILAQRWKRTNVI